MIQDTKEVIKSALILGGLSNVYTYNPERPNVPCAIIEPGISFLKVTEDAYGPIFQSDWRVRVMVPFGANDKETTELDNYLDTLLPTIWEHTDCSTLSADKPFITEVNNANYLSTYLNISIDIQGGN